MRNRGQVRISGKPAPVPGFFVLGTGVLLLLAALVAPARAEDSRVTRAKQIRDEILARRGAPARPAAEEEAEDPLAVAVDAARARLAELDAQIENNRRRSEGLAAPREKLAARSDELAGMTTKLEEQSRRRVEAIYRSAKLGSQAAGLAVGEATSARLSRYLAAIAGAEQEKLAALELERGGVVASLDRARAEEAAVAAELRGLEADRTEADAALTRAGDDAEAEPQSDESEVAAREEDRKLEQRQQEEAAFEKTANANAGLEANAGNAPAATRAPSREPAKDDTNENDAFEDAAAKLRLEAARVKLDAAKAERSRQEAEQLASKNAAPPIPTASGQTTGNDFQWPAPAPGTAPAAKAPAAAEPPIESAAAAATAATAATAPAEPSPAAAPDAGAAAKPRGFLSRLFGGDDRESDRFAASRGALPSPVAGKVVANYGQQHKSGATYRGVILRAGHDAPIHVVADGRVSFVGEVPGMGHTVIVSHGNRYHTVYARLGTVTVKEGDKVLAGAEVGALPDNDADMHFELRDQGKAVDPLPWLRGGVTQ